MGKVVEIEHCCNSKPSIETDSLTKATFIECLSCGHMVGGLSRGDAIKMWNAAMNALSDHTCEPQGNGFCETCGEPCDGHG